MIFRFCSRHGGHEEPDCPGCVRELPIFAYVLRQHEIEKLAQEERGELWEGEVVEPTHVARPLFPHRPTCCCPVCRP